MFENSAAFGISIKLTAGFLKTENLLYLPSAADFGSIFRAMSKKNKLHLVLLNIWILLLSYLYYSLRIPISKLQLEIALPFTIIVCNASFLIGRLWLFSEKGARNQHVGPTSQKNLRPDSLSRSAKVTGHFLFVIVLVGFSLTGLDFAQDFGHWIIFPVLMTLGIWLGAKARHSYIERSK